MPQPRKRRRATSAGDRARKRQQNQQQRVPQPAAAPAAAAAPSSGGASGGNAVVPSSAGMVGISGEAGCPPDVRQKVLSQLTHEEKNTQRWTFPFKDGERFETAEFSQMTCYGPPSNKSRYVMCAKLGEGSFSCVFKAWDTVAKDWAALKFTLSRFAPAPAPSRPLLLCARHLVATPLARRVPLCANPRRPGFPQCGEGGVQRSEQAE